jgi:hypothetical protein
VCQSALRENGRPRGPAGFDEPLDESIDESLDASPGALLDGAPDDAPERVRGLQKRSLRVTFLTPDVLSG